MPGHTEPLRKTTCRLEGLPLELFQNIIHQAILNRVLTRALRLRLIDREEYTLLLQNSADDAQANFRKKYCTCFFCITCSTLHYLQD
jgi:hypothetical protein